MASPAAARYADVEYPDVDYAAWATGRLAEVEPTAEGEDFALAYALVHLSALFTADVEEVVHRPRGLSLPGFRLLFKLLLLGPTRPTRLAKISATSGASITSLVNNLERKRLVRRHLVGEDGRAVEIALTPSGRKVVRAALRSHSEREAEWFAPLGAEERSQLTDLLQRLIAQRPERGRGT